MDSGDENEVVTAQREWERMKGRLEKVQNHKSQ